MPKTKEPAERARGLYRNGRRWWLRVKSPLSGRLTPRSTGANDLAMANNVAGMLTTLAAERTQWDLLDAAERGDVALDVLYDAWAAGTTSELRKRNAAAVEDAADADLSLWVDKWAREHVALMHNVSERHKEIYVRHVRAYIPAGTKFPRSRLTEDYVKARTSALTNPQTGESLSDTTMRQYADSLRRFCHYARRRVPLLSDPFDGADEWLPRANSARSTYWEHDTVLDVLSHMSGDARVMMTLIFGSGMELGAALGMYGRHVGRNLGERVVVAPGTKNEHREDRTIFVDAWAWPIVENHARLVLPKARMWPEILPARRGADVRRAFYEAQVECGLIDAPPVNPATGKKLWHAVNPHTIHDARHTYVVNRMLGLDGEPRQDIRFCAVQLGHADEQMVMRIYAKANIRQRIKMIELREAREAGRREAAGGE